MNNIDLKTLSASRMRLVLIVLVILTFLAQIGLVFLGQSAITSYSSEVSTAIELSSTNSKTLQDLELVSNTLKDHKKSVEKSTKLTVDGSDVYAYQNQIITEITRYAQKAGLTTTGFAFATAGAATDGTAAPATAAPSAPATTTPATGTATTPVATPAGVTPVEVTVTFASNATYEQLYTFLRLLEGSLLRMEVGTLSLSRPAASSAPESGPEVNSIGLSSLNVKVYMKK